MHKVVKIENIKKKHEGHEHHAMQYSSNDAYRGKNFSHIAVLKFVQIATMVFVLPMLFMSRKDAIIIMSSFTALFLIINIAVNAFNSPKEHRSVSGIISSIFARYKINHEKDAIRVLLYNCTAGLITIILFDVKIAAISFVVAVLGDSVATLFGTKFHGLYLKQFGKTITGSLAMVLASFGMIYTFSESLHLNISLVGVCFASAVAAITELFCGRFLRIDDSVAIAVLTGCALRLAILF